MLDGPRGHGAGQSSSRKEVAEFLGGTNGQSQSRYFCFDLILDRFRNLPFCCTTTSKAEGIKLTDYDELL